jgi:outer membrane lipopolysaccharide assembly protein LptE/RlpB
MAAFVAGLILLSGCGYTLHGKGADEGTRSYNLHIPVVKNATLEPLLDRELTSVLKEEVLLDGRWRLTGPAEADILLGGVIDRFELTPLSYDPQDRILEYRVTMYVTLSITDPETGDTLWKDSDMQGFAEYRVTQDVTKSKIKKAEAIRKASKILAEDFIIKAVDSPF